MVLPPTKSMNTDTTSSSFSPGNPATDLPFSLINLLKCGPPSRVEHRSHTASSPASKVGFQSILPILSRSTLDNILPAPSSLLNTALPWGLSFGALDPFAQLATLKVLQETSSRLKSSIAVPLPVRVTPYPTSRPSPSDTHMASPPNIRLPDHIMSPNIKLGDHNNIQHSDHMLSPNLGTPPSIRSSNSSHTRHSSSDESSISSTSLPYHKYSPFHDIYKSRDEKYNTQRHSAFQQISQDMEVENLKAKLTDQVMRQVFLNNDQLVRVTAKDSVTSAHTRTNNVCKYCEKMFPSPSHLLIHLRTHSGERPYPCPGCGKTFATRGHLRRHYRIHTGVKPYKCQVCDKAFANQGNLKTHTRLHTGEKPYKCPRCDKAFADAGNLQRHITTHTGVKPYKCVHCSKAFSRSSNLKTHLLTHTGLKPFSCSCCNKSFTRLSYLKAHMKGIRHADKITSPSCDSSGIASSQSLMTSSQSLSMTSQDSLIAALTDGKTSADFRALGNFSVQVV